MEITLATKEDIEGILPLQKQIYRVKELSPNAKNVLEDLIDSEFCDLFVAKMNSQIVGSGTVFYLNIPAHGTYYAFLEGVVTDSQHRGQGIGTALSKFAIDLAKKKNCYKIIFTSGMDRKDIHQFYTNLGFKQWGLEFRLDLE